MRSRLPSRSGRRNRFSSFGADPSKVRNFTGGSLLTVKSGPDVFADALVPHGRMLPRIFSKILFCLIARGVAEPGLRRRLVSSREVRLFDFAACPAAVRSPVGLPRPSLSASLMRWLSVCHLKG
jgi:hypothetical protein